MSLDVSITFPKDAGEDWSIEHKIRDILVAYLQPVSRSSPQEAALELIMLYQLESEKQQLAQSILSEGFWYMTWEIVFKLAEQVPAANPSQDRLIALILALRDANVEPTNPYAELPHMGIMLSETFHRKKFTYSFFFFSFRLFRSPIALAFSADTARPEISAAPPPPGTDFDQSQWKSLNALSARLGAAAIVFRPGDAIIAIAEALEKRPDPRSRAYQARAPLLNFHVPIAADWIIRCAEQLYAVMRSGEAEGAGCPWKRGGGFSRSGGASGRSS